MSKQLDNSQRTGRFSRRLALRPQAEALESRSLLNGTPFVWLTMPALTRLGAYNVNTPSATATGFNSTPVAAASNPVGVALDHSGNIWVTEANIAQVQEFNTAGANLHNVPLTGPAAGITVGADGMIYVAEPGTGLVEEINPNLAVPIVVNGVFVGGTPEGITHVGSFLWVTQNTTSSVQELGTEPLVLVNAPIPVGAGPTGIAFGPNNTVWFTEIGINDIGEIAFANTAAPVPTLFALPRVGPSAISVLNYTPVGIAEGSDGNMWFTLQTTAAGDLALVPPLIGVIHFPNTAVVNTQTWQRVGGAATYEPVSIAAGPDGNVWFTMEATGRGLVGGPNGNLSDRIGVVNVANGTDVINSQELPNGADFLNPAFSLLPFGIAADPTLPKSAPVTHQSNTLLASRPGGLRFF